MCVVCCMLFNVIFKCYLLRICFCLSYKYLFIHTIIHFYSACVNEVLVNCKLLHSDRAHEGVDLRKSAKSRSVRQTKSGYSSRYEDSSYNESSYSSSSKTSRSSRKYTEETVEESSYSSRRSDRKSKQRKILHFLEVNALMNFTTRYIWWKQWFLQPDLERKNKVFGTFSYFVIPYTFETLKYFKSYVKQIVYS